MSRRLLHLLGWTAIAAVAVLIFAEPAVVDLDLWGSMAMGRETTLHGWPPTRDSFAYVPTQNPVVYHEWLSGVLFYLLLDGVGSWALKALMIALGLGALGFAALAAHRLGAAPLSLFVLLLVALVSMQRGYSPIRAQAFTFFFFACFIYLLEAATRGDRRPLLIIPPLTVVWANLHGGFVAGIGLLFLYLVSEVLQGRKPWRLLAAAGGAVMGTLLNPYGLDYWAYLREALLMPRPQIPEWAPLPWDLTSAWPFKATLLLSGLTVTIAPKRYWPGILVLGVTAVLGVRHVRHIPFFAIATVAFLPFHLSPVLTRLGASFRPRVAVRPVLMTVLASLLLFWLVLASLLQLTHFTAWELKVPADYYPVGAVEFLRLNGLSGNLATPYNWGEYVLWKLAPRVKVSFDGRYETVYPHPVSTDNFNFMYGTGDWRRLLRVYPTEMVLVDKRYPMALQMGEEPGWVRVYEDKISALYLPADRSQGPWRHPPTSQGTIP